MGQTHHERCARPQDTIGLSEGAVDVFDVVEGVQRKREIVALIIDALQLLDVALEERDQHALTLGQPPPELDLLVGEIDADDLGALFRQDDAVLPATAAEHEGVLVTLLQGNVEELKGIDDESYDLALSMHALNYVEHVDRAFAEAYRVLRPGAPFVMSLAHPFDACLQGDPPYGVTKGYWERERDWQWEFPKDGVSARLRSWYRPVSEWFSLLTDAGFRVERLLEPVPTEEAWSPWDGGYSLEKMRLVPANLIIKAVKP